jgi:hypothetical protein
VELSLWVVAKVIHEIGDRAPHDLGYRQIMRFRQAHKLRMIRNADRNAQANAWFFASWARHPIHSRRIFTPKNSFSNHRNVAFYRGYGHSLRSPGY